MVPSVFVWKTNPVLNYTGLDVSKSLIELARSIYPEATFLKYDGHALPCFDNRWDNKTAISYIVINFREFMKFIEENFGKDGSRIESYGYFSKPTELANIPYKHIFMCSLKFEKNSKSPGIFIDIPD